ncbi:Sodium channel protein 60E [Orchesella cincta]|uniref:Sodium channel protein n=1 Tax=Orchesella cincta TaxID=48709 RepID=A0A1D2ML09_ORCCI|nr:Sodium channel protein 60E [Orchesella cincta]
MKQVTIMAGNAGAVMRSIKASQERDREASGKMNAEEEDVPINAEKVSAQNSQDNDEENQESKVSLTGSWFGVPVEEVDPLIYVDTFCVLSKKFGRHYIFRYSSTKSLYLLGPLHPIRKIAILITTHRVFDLVIIFTILCNCVTLAMITNIYDDAGEELVPNYDSTINYIEYAFLAIFSLELILKVLAKGLIINKFSYLRNRWNLLDFIVVTSGYITIIADLRDTTNTNKKENSLDFLRTFRLQNLLFITDFDCRWGVGLRMMINALLSSVVQLLEVMALTVACLMIFSLFALQLFRGKLLQKCVLIKGGPEDPEKLINKPIDMEPEGERDRLWTEWVSDWKHWKRRDFPIEEAIQCGNGSGMRLCGDGYTCIGELGGNPDGGWTSFDNFFGSMLSTFQLLTLDYWERLYDLVVSTCGTTSVIFFLLVIFLGAYYLFNLMLAVVAMSYENEAQNSEQDAFTTFGHRLTAARMLSNFSFDSLSKLELNRLTQYRRRTAEERKALARKMRFSGYEEDDEGQTGAGLGDAVFSLLGLNTARRPTLTKDPSASNSVANVLAPEVKNPSKVELKTLKDKEEEDNSKAPSSGSNVTPLKAQVSQMELGEEEFEDCEEIVGPNWYHRFAYCMRCKMRPLVNHMLFDTTITVCIIANTVVLAMEHHGSTKDLENILIIANHVFMAIFTLECIIKIMALQKVYFQTGWNIFDMIIVLISYVDLASVSQNTGTRGLSVIRSMRLLRVFKLAQSWITMKVLLNIIFSSFGALGNLTCVLLIIIYIFSVMGMQIVGKEYKSAAFDAAYFKCFAIFLPILVVGNFIVLNLFLALLLNSFDTEELNAQREKELEAKGRAENIKNIVGLLLKKEQKKDSTVSDSVIDEMQAASANKSTRPTPKASKATGQPIAQESEARKNFKRMQKKVIMQVRKEAAERAIAKAENKAMNVRNTEQRLFLKPNAAKQIAERDDHTIINSQSQYTPEGSVHSDQLNAPGDCCPALCCKPKYCRTFLGGRQCRRRRRRWSKFRGFCMTIVGRTGAAQNLGALKALRTLRALRPLRAISRWQGMKIVVNALTYAIPSIFNVLLVCLLFWLIFSIMGVQFFKGQFFRCVDSQGEKVDPRLAPTKEVCCSKAASMGYSWINAVSNYDNVVEGYLSLFQVATFEGWIELMEYSVDAAGVDKQPVPNNQIEFYAFYVIFIIFGSFFTLQLFIGVIIDNFNMLKKKYEGNMVEIFLTPSQRNYYIAMKNLGAKRPKKVIKPPTQRFRLFFYGIALSRKLEIAIYILIFLNMIIQACEYYGEGRLVMDIIASCNFFFTVVYILEASVKIIGLGSNYFNVPQNVFDFILVIASAINDFIHGNTDVIFPIPPTLLRIARITRIGRILRLVKAAKGIRKLLFALIVSLPALFNIGALLGLITFIYSILGMSLFGKAPKKWSIDNLFNFETFSHSNLMLLRLMTAAGWNEVLDSMTYMEPVCGTYRHLECGLPGEPECPSRVLVVAYIVSYLVLTYLIVINLYIAIILENYVEASNEEDVGIVEDDLEMFYVRWSRYDPKATQFISFDVLQDFLDSLDPPLGVPKPNIVAIVAFNLPIARGNKLHCLDILHALISYVLGQVDDSAEFRKLQAQMERKFQKQFPTRRLLDIVSSTRRWKFENNAARKIQRYWRAYRKRKNAVPVAPVKSVASRSIRHGHGGTATYGGMGGKMMTSIAKVP